MLRDKSLIPLSHQHQHALALCVRIDRAAPIPGENLDAWQAEIAQQFRGEIYIHFAAEEQLVFPAARRFDELAPLIQELLAEHRTLRAYFATAEGREMTPFTLVEFAHALSAHIRKEERQLFERLQQLLKPEELSGLGKQLEQALADSTNVCILPNEATRLRPVDN